MHSKDLDGDGRDDLIWLNNRTGVVLNWLGRLDGGFSENYQEAAIGTLLATGDFNGDGRSDLIWRQGAEELYLTQTFEGAAFYFQWSTGFLRKLPLEWGIAATGDYNGDGRDDLLLTNSNGTVTDWLGRADFGFDSNHATASYVLPQGWHVEGSGDINGDGRDDVLLRHDDGTVTNWLGQSDGGFFSNHQVATYGLPTEWHIASMGDFNGDGRDDALLRHDNGTITEWLGQADGGFYSNHAIATYALHTSWHVAGTGDFNGDGRDDVLLRHDNGTITDWLSAPSGAFSSNHMNATYVVDLAWQLQPNPACQGCWDYW